MMNDGETHGYTSPRVDGRRIPSQSVGWTFFSCQCEDDRSMSEHKWCGGGGTSKSCRSKAQIVNLCERSSHGASQGGGTGHHGGHHTGQQVTEHCSAIL